MSQTIGTIVANSGQRKMRKEGLQMQAEAKEKIENFEWQDLDVPVSTMGSDLMREEAARSSAMSIDALKGSDRALIGGIGQVQANNNNINREVAATLDQQINSDAATKRAMIETRQANELAGYGQMFNTGMGMKYKAYADFAQSAGNQSQHVMDLFTTFGGGGAGGGGGK